MQPVSLYRTTFCPVTNAWSGVTTRTERRNSTELKRFSLLRTDRSPVVGQGELIGHWLTRTCLVMSYLDLSRPVPAGILDDECSTLFAVTATD